MAEQLRSRRDRAGRGEAWTTATAAGTRVGTAGGGNSGGGSPTTTETLDDVIGASRTSATKRYPRLGRVSTKRGTSAESFSAERILLMAVPRLWSKSTKVSAGHNLFRISSRETTSPGRSSSITKRSKGWACRRILWPSRRNSPESRCAAKRPKRITLGMSMDFRVAGGREALQGRLSISFAGVNFTVAAAKSHRERWLSVER